MAQRLHGLIGSGRGPRITIPGKATVWFAVVCGLKSEECPVEVHVEHHDQSKSTHLLLVDGRIELPTCRFVQFEYKGRQKYVTCMLEAA